MTKKCWAVLADKPIESEKLNEELIEDTQSLFVCIHIYVKSVDLAAIVLISIFLYNNKIETIVMVVVVVVVLSFVRN